MPSRRARSPAPRGSSGGGGGGGGSGSLGGRGGGGGDMDGDGEHDNPRGDVEELKQMLDGCQRELKDLKEDLKDTVDSVGLHLGVFFLALCSARGFLSMMWVTSRG